LRERYGDDPSTHPDFDPDSWMEARSSGGPDRNRVYGLSNTTAENLRTTHSVSTVSAQSQEFVALQQHITHLIEKYERLSADYEQLCQMSWILDHKWKVRVCPFFGRLFLGTTSLLLLLLLQHRHCSNLIFIWTYKFVMNIWILYYSSLFLHISILYNFIFFIIIFFLCSKDFKKYIFFNYYRWIYKRTQSFGIYIPEARGTIYFICNYNTVTSLMKLFCQYFTEGSNKFTINTTTNHRRNNSINVLKWVILFFLAHIFCL